MSKSFAGANTQGETLDEARANLAEAVELVLEADRMLTSDFFTRNICRDLEVPSP